MVIYFQIFFDFDFNFSFEFDSYIFVWICIFPVWTCISLRGRSLVSDTADFYWFKMKSSGNYAEVLTNLVSSALAFVGAACNVESPLAIKP